MCLAIGESMKKYLAIAAVALGALTSCVRNQAVLDPVDRCDSLTNVVMEKDSLINRVFEEINTVVGNLSQIKMRENLIAVPENAEGGFRPIEQMKSDMEAIDRLLQENRSKIASLQNIARRLRKANVQIEALEKTIVGLNEHLAEKTAEAETLREELARREEEVAYLETQVAERDAEVETLNEENVELENRLNTVYYIVGSEKELRDAQIINKEGFIGRTLTVGRGGAIDSFTKVDVRLLTEVPVGRKRATVVTPHPQGSYDWVIGEDKRMEKLVITDPTRFWESSKILIVSYK